MNPIYFIYNYLTNRVKTKKILFLDIDGTLTEPGTIIPPLSAQKAIRTARNNGHLVYLCTGRSKGMMEPLLTYGFDGYIASAGNYIACNGQVIFSNPMSHLQRDRILEVFKKYDIYPSVECEDAAYIYRNAKQLFLKHAGGNPNSELMRWRQELESDLNILPMEQYHDQDVFKIVFVAESTKNVELAHQELSDIGHFSVGEKDSYGLINGEVSLKGFDKGSGVRMVCEKCGISIENSIGFGDSINDYEMLQTVNYAVCMENGIKEIKNIVDYVCPAVDKDGIFHAFQKLNLI